MMHQNVPHPRFLALLAVADVYLNTSLREGMSLSAHEFLYMTCVHFLGEADSAAARSRSTRRWS